MPETIKTSDTDLEAASIERKTVGKNSMTQAGKKSKFWESFGDSSLYSFSYDPTDESLAANILKEYQIDCKTTHIGGNLPSVDIKHGNALELIKLSLLEDSIDNTHGPYEAYVDYDSNSVEFREVGGYSANIGYDVYQQIQTGVYVENCSGVIVTGKNPLPTRKPLVWNSLLKDGLIFNATKMTSNCSRKDFDTFCILTYDDQNLDSSKYDDGIDNFYDLTTPYENIIGYARRKWADIEKKPEASVIDSNTSSVPLRVVGSTTAKKLGELQKPPDIPSEIEQQKGADLSCWVDKAEDAAVNDGIEIKIPTELRYTTAYGDIIDKYIGIADIFVVGKEMTGLFGRPVTANDLKSTSTTKREIWASINVLPSESRIFKLEEGVEYAIVYKDKKPYIVFANQAFTDDDAEYGDSPTFNVYPNCKYAANLTIEETRGLKDKGSILPTGNYNGILVEEVWAMVDLETPCILIKDPNGDALTIAKELEYDVAALVIEDKPAPMAFAGKSSPGGRLIDQASQQSDNDPTTKQSLMTNDYETVLNEIDKGGGIQLTLSFLDENQCIKLAGLLYKYMNNQDGIEIVYTCGPDSNPKVGGYTVGGGIVNSVVHQYSDSGSYTVSVTESGRLISDSSLAGIDGGPYTKKIENVSARGTVVSDMGNHIFYQIRIDGFGIKLGVNVSKDILRIGDKVSCTIHNNPIEM